MKVKILKANEFSLSLKGQYHSHFSKHIDCECLNIRLVIVFGVREQKLSISLKGCSFDSPFVKRRWKMKTLKTNILLIDHLLMYYIHLCLDILRIILHITILVSLCAFVIYVYQNFDAKFVFDNDKCMRKLLFHCSRMLFTFSTRLE